MSKGSTASSADIDCMGSISPPARWLPAKPWRLEDRSSLRAAVEQLRRGFGHPLAVPEKSLGVAADKINLMLAAFLPHRLPLLDRMRSCHFGDEFGKQMCFGTRPIEHLIRGKQI